MATVETLSLSPQSDLHLTQNKHEDIITQWYFYHWIKIEKDI